MAKLANFIKAYGWFHKVLAEAKTLSALLEHYVGEHQAQLQGAEKYDRYRCTKGGKLYGDKIIVRESIGIIWGHPIGQPPKRWIPQALRFPIEGWTAAKAKRWLAENKIRYIGFKTAKKEYKETFVRLGQISGLNKILRDIKKRNLKQMERNIEKVKGEKNENKQNS